MRFITFGSSLISRSASLLFDHLQYGTEGEGLDYVICGTAVCITAGYFHAYHSADFWSHGFLPGYVLHDWCSYLQVLVPSS